jgi:diphthine-ammonia ligase
VSFWAPPNIGPYSQLNKVDNVLLMAGCIGLYPPRISLIDSNDEALQYKQIRENLSQILREQLQDQSLTFKHVTQSAIVFISRQTDLSKLLPLLQHDLKDIGDKSVVVRVEMLPMNSLVEVEVICDAGPEHGKRRVNVW